MTDTTIQNGNQQPEPPKSDPLITVTQEINQEVRDALFLLHFAISSGFGSEEGSASQKSVPESDISTIKSFAALLDIYTDTLQSTEQVKAETEKTKQVRVSEWTAFELAYQRLVKLTYPITAATLRATEVARGGHAATAAKFARIIWGITGLFVVFVVVAEWATGRWGPVLDGQVEPLFWYSVLQIIRILIPFAYGGLGACVFLLRSAHKHFYQRSFDIHRRPEYFNRIILGVIGGGAVVLFVNQLTTENGNVIELSSAALGFLAGYSTEFLFQTIERVIAAILPRVGVETIRRRAPAKSNIDVPVGDLTLDQLLQRHDAATEPEDKRMYRALIQKLQERM